MSQWPDGDPGMDEQYQQGGGLCPLLPANGLLPPSGRAGPNGKRLKRRENEIKSLESFQMALVPWRTPTVAWFYPDGFRAANRRARCGPANPESASHHDRLDERRGGCIPVFGVASA